jgi:hypothetical protein
MNIKTNTAKLPKLSAIQIAALWNVVVNRRAVPAALKTLGFGNARTTAALIRVGLVELDAFRAGYRLTVLGCTWVELQTARAEIEAYEADPAAAQRAAELDAMRHIGTFRGTCLRNNCPGCSQVDRDSLVEIARLAALREHIRRAQDASEAMIANGTFAGPEGVATLAAELDAMTLGARWDVCEYPGDDRLTRDWDAALAEASRRAGGCGRVILATRIAGPDVCRVAVQCGDCLREANRQYREQRERHNVRPGHEALHHPAELRELDHAAAIRENRVHDAALAGHDMNLRMEGEWRRAAQMHEFARAHLGCCSVPSTISVGARRTDWLRAVEHAHVEAWAEQIDRQHAAGRIDNMLLTFLGMFVKNGKPGSRAGHADAYFAWKRRHCGTEAAAVPADWTRWFLADEAEAHAMNRSYSQAVTDAANDPLARLASL